MSFGDGGFASIVGGGLVHSVHVGVDGECSLVCVVGRCLLVGAASLFIFLWVVVCLLCSVVL